MAREQMWEATVLVTEFGISGRAFQTTVVVSGTGPINAERIENEAQDAYLASGGRIQPSERDVPGGGAGGFVTARVLRVWYIID